MASPRALALATVQPYDRQHGTIHRAGSSFCTRGSTRPTKAVGRIPARTARSSDTRLGQSRYIDQHRPRCPGSPLRSQSATEVGSGLPRRCFDMAFTPEFHRAFAANDGSGCQSASVRSFCQRLRFLQPRASVRGATDLGHGKRREFRLCAGGIEHRRSISEHCAASCALLFSASAAAFFTRVPPAAFDRPCDRPCELGYPSWLVAASTKSM